LTKTILLKSQETFELRLNKKNARLFFAEEIDAVTQCSICLSKFSHATYLVNVPTFFGMYVNPLGIWADIFW
jgi:hypothetical protein